MNQENQTEKITTEVTPTVESAKESFELPKSTSPVNVPLAANDKILAKKIAADISQAKDTGVTNMPGNNMNVEKLSEETYIKEAEGVIARDQGDPFKEEEDHEDIQIKYIKDKFGKDIAKG